MGWTQAEAASRAGVDRDTIGAWERGGPGPDELRVMGLAYLYGRPLSWFYDDEEAYVSPLHLASRSGRVLALMEVLKAGAAARRISLDELLGADDSSPGSPADLPDFDSAGSFPVAAAAGAGAEVLDESRVSHVSLDPGWLRSHALSPDRCDVISVRGVSMEPTLPDGCSILVDRGSRELAEGRVFVLRTAEGLVVKRVRLEEGNWILAGDNPDWDPAPLAEGDDVVGEVRWSGRFI